MKTPLEETPAQSLSPRGRKFPIQVLVFTGHDTYELAWYHKGRWYETNPAEGYVLNAVTYGVVAWEYLPPKPKLPEDE